jgi:hypothetical protein
MEPSKGQRSGSSLAIFSLSFRVLKLTLYLLPESEILEGFLYVVTDRVHVIGSRLTGVKKNLFLVRNCFLETGQTLIMAIFDSDSFASLIRLL